MLKKFFPLFFILFSCGTNHLYVQVENIDADYLASVHENTPDYRQENPPHGQRINVLWNVPKRMYYEDLSLKLTVRFWNNTEKNIIYKINSRFGCTFFFFENKKMDTRRKILTYKIDICNSSGKSLETWKHQFWTELVDIDEN